MKKGLTKIKLVSRTPKEKKVIEDLQEEVPVQEEKFESDYLNKWTSENTDNYFFIKDAIRDMFYYIINSNDNDKEKLKTSLGINEFIKEYKFDKEYHHKIRKDVQPTFFPILNGSSTIFNIYFGKSLVDIVKEVSEESPTFTVYEDYIINELHNFINYRKTSIILLPKVKFDRLHDTFLNIKDEFAEHYILGKKKYYSKDDFNLDPFKIMEDDILYKIVYIVPRTTYGDKKVALTKNNPRGIMAPVILDKNGIPIKTKLWNSIAEINKNYKLELPVKCLIPLKTFISNENKVIKMSNKVLINNFSKLKCFKESLNKKISLLLFSITETYYNRRYL